MGKWGQRAQAARKAVAGGGETTGRRAAKATDAGHLGDDGRVYVRRKVVADYSDRERKQPNRNGV
ncbi:hypothetical protein OHA18_40495 [Kribbella sp. NBC_00709]|uniref:hypothetical protein n=1 Tax=Kribbella sp. NBC_00709 TaxID=2975972 RepID=UPI002E2864D3|nr:hypothetical protein [Kribbella sp. NBC_00709]